MTKANVYDAIFKQVVTQRTPSFSILTSRLKDGYFILWTRGDIEVIHSFVCGHFDICVQRVCFKMNNSTKNEKNDANMSDKIFIFSARKKQYLQYTKKLCIFNNMRFILGGKACFYFFCFCLCHAIWFFFLSTVQ